MKNLLYAGALLALIALTSGARADSIFITDIADGTPTVQVLDANGMDVTAARVIIQADSGPEFLHFLLALPPGLTGGGFDAFTDIFEGSLRGPLSDRFRVTGPAGTPFNEVFFASDPNISLIDISHATFQFPSVVEDGTPQLVGSVGNPGFSNDDYFVQSDVDVVPEPASATLVLLGAVGIAGAIRRRRLACS